MVKKCKNCEKEIAENLNFCNEQCLREYQKKKQEKIDTACPESAKIIEEDTPFEIKEIMDFLGRGSTDGNVRGSHLGKVLSVCRNPPKNVKNYRDLLSYLALICGMNKRYVTENYLDGLEVCGVITTIESGNDRFFKWIGKKAFERNNGEK